MNTPTKILVGLIGFAILVVVLFTWVFPWVERNFVNDPTLALSLVYL